MSRYSNNSNIKVNGNYIGGNVINNRREYHHHHSKPPRNGYDANSEFAAIIFTALAVIWFYSKHAYEIYEYIKVGAFVSICLYISVLAINFLLEQEDLKRPYVAIYGVSIGMATILLAQYGINNLNPQLVDIGLKSKNAWAFWSQLNAYGHQLIIQSLTGAMLTGATVIISTLMGAYLLWCTIADSYFEYGDIPRLLTPFRPSIAGVISAVLLVLSWLFTSGYIFQLLE